MVRSSFGEGVLPCVLFYLFPLKFSRSAHRLATGRKFFLVGRGIKRHRDASRWRSGLERGRSWLIEDGGRLPVRPEQRLDALSQLRIRRTFSVENCSLMDGIRGFDGRHENGLNTFRIDGHGIFLGKELTLECAVWGVAVVHRERQDHQRRSRASEGPSRT